MIIFEKNRMTKESEIIFYQDDDGNIKIEVLFKDETLVNIGKKHNKTSAQVTLRYLIQRGVSVLPKTVNKERMKQNFDVFDFVLNEDEMNQILQLDQAKSLFFSHQDPETVERLTSLVRKFED